MLEEVAQSVGAQQALVSSAHPKTLPCQAPPQAMNSLALLLQGKSWADTGTASNPGTPSGLPAPAHWCHFPHP